MNEEPEVQTEQEPLAAAPAPPSNPQKEALVNHAAKLNKLSGEIKYPGVTDSHSHSNLLAEIAKDLLRIAGEL